MALQEYKCPSCGGAIEFDSNIQKMKCPYCDTEFEMDAIRELEEEINREQPDDMTWDTGGGEIWQEGDAPDMAVYVCRSCGGEIIGDQSTGATSCPFCGNPVVILGKFTGDLRPDYVIPFKLDKQAAKEGLLKHFKGKRLLPKVFKTENHIDEVKGMYVPFWLYDTDAQAHIRYRATRIRKWSDTRFDYTEISHFSVIRDGTLGFDKVPVDGSSKLANDLLESLEPYNYNDVIPFQSGFLAGYLADRYDVSAEESAPRANERVKQSTEDAIRNTVTGYATVTPEQSSIRLQGGKVSYALLPVWILQTSWRGENYLFAMNGQTGRFVGNLPVDRVAFWKWWGLLTAIFSVAAYIGLWILM